MTKLISKIAFLSLAVLWFYSPTTAAETIHPNSLIPVPAEISWQEGELAFSSSFDATLTGVKEPRIQGAVQRFLDHLAKRINHPSSQSIKTPTLFINCGTKGLPVQSVREDESYTLTVTPKEAMLSAPNPLGILHGLQTLLQLVQKEDQGFAIPCVTIHDKPRFPWRGLLIDACRHWMPVEVIKRNLDGMAEAKMNVLHWHLSENQGFRVESKIHPKLQGMGSDGKFYTQDQAREIVAYARDRGIRVVPEFDMPGHTTAWLVGYPELAAAPGPYEIDKKFGVFDPSMNPASEELYQFLDGFIGEMAALFPDEYFHIGGDEVNGKQWNQNPAIQRFIYGHGLKSNEDLQAYFNSRLEKILTRRRKKMMGWDEILHPDLPKTILVQSWRGPDGLADSAKKGFDTILSNGYYLDLAQPASIHYAVDPLPQGPQAEGQAVGVPGLGTKSTTGSGPIPAKSGLTPSQKAHVLGGEACMWSELVSPETVDSRIWPRALAVAERLWSPAGVQDVDNFYDRMFVESGRLEELGLTHRSYYLPLLKRLAGDADVKPLRVLADVVEPVKNYQRHRWGAYTSGFPLNRLADAARPESEMAWFFRTTVDSYLKEAPGFGDFEGLRMPLRTWKENHKALEPILKKYDLLVDVLPQSQDLSASARVGLEAVQYLKSGKAAPPSWLDKANQTLNRAQEPKAQVEIAIIPSLRKLALAAAQLDKLKGMSVAEWNKSLDDQVEAGKPKGW